MWDEGVNCISIKLNKKLRFESILYICLCFTVSLFLFRTPYTYLALVVEIGWD